MLIDLVHKALVQLVNGGTPDYKDFNNPLIESTGSFNGSTGEWRWDKYKLDACSDVELFEIYVLCKKTWE